MADSNFQELLKQTTIFADLDTAALEDLRSIGVFIHAPAGKTIFEKGDPGDRLYLIVLGIVGIFSVSQDGKTLMHNRLGSGGVMGEIALMSGLTRSAGATAVTDTVLFELEKAPLLAFLERHPRVSIRLLQVMALTFHHVSERREDAHFLNVRQRMAKLLIWLVDDAGATAPMRQEDFAQLLGVTREAVNKAIRHLVAAGLITSAGGAITVPNIQRLRDAAEDGTDF